MFTQDVARLRKRYFYTIVDHEPNLDTARRLAIFIGCCFKYRVGPEDVWVTPREIANLLLYFMRKAEMIDELEYAKRQIYDCYDRFGHLRFADLWVMVEHIFPEIVYEKLEIMSSYKQITSS